MRLNEMEPDILDSIKKDIELEVTSFINDLEEEYTGMEEQEAKEEAKRLWNNELKEDYSDVLKENGVTPDDELLKDLEKLYVKKFKKHVSKLALIANM
jgi:hypothetical protein